MIIAGKDEIGEKLAWMHRERHAHLYQYVEAVVHRKGLTHAEAAAYMGLSPQRIAQLKKKGQEQRRVGVIYDLSAWPGIQERQRATVGGKSKEVPPRQRAHFRRMNAKAKEYRPGQDARPALKFYQMVRELHLSGVSYNAMARCLGESERVFTRRVVRWGVSDGKAPSAGPAVERQEKSA